MQVQLGGRTFTPQQRVLTDGKAFDVVVQVRREHPHRVRLSSTFHSRATWSTTPG